MQTTILTDLVRQFLDATASWHGALLPIAESLFLTLAAIQLAWSAAWWVLGEEDPAAIWVLLLRRILSLGFFWAVLVNANAWVPAVIESFVAAGRRAASAAGANVAELNPSTVVDQGIRISAGIWNAVDTSGWISAMAGALLAALVSLLVFLAFALIAANLVIALVEMCVVIGGGVILLGFAGATWTLPFAERYLSLAIATGVKLFLLYMVVGLGTALAASWEPIVAEAGSSAPAFFEVLAGALVYAAVAWNVPSYASGLLGGSIATHLESTLRGAVTTGTWAMAPRALARGFALEPAARSTAALLEAGRYATSARASGAGLASSVLQGGAALGASTARAGFYRLAGLSRAPASAHLRERRAIDFALRAGPHPAARAETKPVERAGERAVVLGSSARAESSPPANDRPEKKEIA